MKSVKLLFIMIILLWPSFIFADESKVIAWWDFDTKGAAEGSTPGKIGNAVEFNGSNFIESELSGLYESTTISMWIKINELVTPFTSLISTNSWGESDIHLLFLQNGRLQLSINNNQPVDVSCDPDASSSFGKWIHLAVTYDSKEKEAVFYIDGKAVKQQQYQKALPVHFYDFCTGSWAGRERFFYGLMDEICIYKRAVNSDEIEKLFRGEKINDGLLLKWSFDKIDADETGDESGKGHSGYIKTAANINYVFDKIGKQNDLLEGNYKIVDGVKGKAIELDGFTASINRSAQQAPKIDGTFSIEAWVALGSYPLYLCPLLDHLATGATNAAGYLFGIQEDGRVCLQVAVDGKLVSVVSDQPIPFRQWQHIAGNFDPQQGLTVYINGKESGRKIVTGTLTPAENTELLIGRSRHKQKPALIIRPASNGEVYSYFDGLIDELKIVPFLPTERYLEEVAKQFKNAAEPDIPLRSLPAEPHQAVRFGAYYTKLKFYEQWDALWRVSDKADVVVCFEESPIRFVFWRGTNYIPHWVTENGIWYMNEFNETWTGVEGCGEPMSDKQCRYTHVRILNSSDARVVVHWRYALSDVFYKIARTDPITDWGDWTDEVYTVYPDGIGIRQIQLNSSEPKEPHEWHESEVIMGQGKRPEDVIEPEGLTAWNPAGESVTFSWKDGPPPYRPSHPEGAHLWRVNTKSRFRPFFAVRPQDNPSFDIYGGEIRRNISMYPWWNHWPAATFPSDGRYAAAADRASSTAFNHVYWAAYQTEDHRITKIMLHGLSGQNGDVLLRIVRAWSHPPELKLHGRGFTSEGYDQTQRAYILTSAVAGKPGKISFTLQANNESPVVNPAFVIRNWGEREVKLKLDSREITHGKTFRFGYERRLDGTDLVLWIKYQTDLPLNIELQGI